METKAAFIYIAPNNDYKKHKAFIDSPVVKLAVVGVESYEEAETASKKALRPLNFARASGLRAWRASKRRLKEKL